METIASGDSEIHPNYSTLLKDHCNSQPPLCVGYYMLFGRTNSISNNKYSNLSSAFPSKVGAATKKLLSLLLLSKLFFFFCLFIFTYSTFYSFFCGRARTDRPPATRRRHRAPTHYSCFYFDRVGLCLTPFEPPLSPSPLTPHVIK